MSVRIGLIGAGGWAGHIRSTLESLGGVQFAGQTGRDWKRLLDAKLDGVAIAIPPQYQPDIIRAFVAQSVAVFAEKPLAASLAAAREIEAACVAAGARVMVDHVDLFNPAFVAVRQTLPRLGAIRTLEATIGRSAASRADRQPHWEFAPHMLAMMFELLGRPATVQATLYGQRAAGLYNVEMRFSFDDAVATVRAGNVMDGRHRRMRLTCERGEALYDDEGENRASVRVGQEPPSSLPYAPTRPLTAALACFAEMARSTAPDVRHVTLGRQVVELLTQVDSSIALGRAVPCEVM